MNLPMSNETASTSKAVPSNRTKMTLKGPPPILFYLTESSVYVLTSTGLRCCLAASRLDTNGLVCRVLYWDDGVLICGLRRNPICSLFVTQSPFFFFEHFGIITSYCVKKIAISISQPLRDLIRNRRTLLLLTLLMGINGPFSKQTITYLANSQQTF